MPQTPTIDLAALRHNAGIARSRSGDARIWAVVKADAYGHGLDRALEGFAQADGLTLSRSLCAEQREHDAAFSFRQINS